jgi:hypothetical protein
MRRPIEHLVDRVHDDIRLLDGHVVGRAVDDLLAALARQADEAVCSSIQIESSFLATGAGRPSVTAARSPAVRTMSGRSPKPGLASASAALLIRSSPSGLRLGSFSKSSSARAWWSPSGSPAVSGGSAASDCLLNSGGLTSTITTPDTSSG